MIANKITQEKYYQPAEQKNVDNIVFNYFEGDLLINKKYRSTTGKYFTQTKDTKKLFYGINDVIGEDEVYIVEGEIDKLTFWQIGIKNCISVPNGANDLNDVFENCEQYLADVKTFYIAVDMDEPGKKLESELVKRLGAYRCKRIKFETKDANEELLNLTLEQVIDKPIDYPISGTFSMSDLEGDLLDLYNNGLPETIAPKNPCFGELKKIFSVVRGQLTVITGIPSHGKSNFAEWYGLNLVNDYDLRASFFSPEHSPMSLHASTFIQKAIGRNYWKSYQGINRINEDDIKRFIDWSNKKIYFTSPEKGEVASWDWLIEKFKEQIFRYGIDMFFIDAFNKVDLGAGNKLDEINRVLTKLTAFAQSTNTMIFLVAHPTKMKKDESTGLYQSPSLYDVSGSADFRNQTHNGFCVYRYFTDPMDDNNENGYTEFINLKTKFQFQGEIGASVLFDYHIPTGRYYARGTFPPDFDMTKKETESSAINPNKDFEQLTKVDF